MAKSVSSAYLAEESKDIGGKYSFYIAIDRSYYTIQSGVKRSFYEAPKESASDNEGFDGVRLAFVDNAEDGYNFISYFVDDLDGGFGTFVNTVFKNAGSPTDEDKSTITLDTLQLSGYYETDVIDTEKTTDWVIYEKVLWDEVTTGSGSIKCYIRTASTSSDVANAVYEEVTNGTIYHKKRKRYFQLKFTLDRTDPNDTVELSNIRVVAKGYIGMDEIKDLGSIDYGVGIFMDEVRAGENTIRLDNSNNQWLTSNANGYVYNKLIYGMLIEIWAGVWTGSDYEWTLQWRGIIESIEYEAGIHSKKEVKITSRDFIYDKLIKTKIGTPASNGDPQPVMFYKRYRVPCKEIDDTNHIYQIYVKNSILSIDAVYKRNNKLDRWETVSATKDVGSKQVTLSADPQGIVAVDILVNYHSNPITVIYRLLVDYLELENDYIDYDSIALAFSRTYGLTVGCSFEDITILEAIRYLLTIADSCLYVEEGKIKVWAYYPDQVPAIDLDESDYRLISISEDGSNIQNKLIVPYANYEDNKSQIIVKKNNYSINVFGEKAYTYRYTFQDPVSVVETVTMASDIVEKIVRRRSTLLQVITLEVYSKVNRININDVVRITNSELGYTDLEFRVTDKMVNLLDLTGMITLVRYIRENWLYFGVEPTDPNYKLGYDRYFVDYYDVGIDGGGVPEDQVPYMSYFY